MFKTSKHIVDPRSEKQRVHRKPPRHRRYDKEDAWVQKWTMRKFRRFLKQNVQNEVYYTARNRDYRTNGWISW